MVNLVILAVMIVVWAQAPVSHVGVREVAALNVLVEPGTMYRAPTATTEIEAGAVIEVDQLGIGAGYWVCTLGDLPVHGAPGDQFPVLYTLRYGDEVGIHERHPVKPDWVMIGRAEWVWLGGLCRE